MCLIAKGSKEIKHCGLHHFLDASEEGYGQVTYLQTVDENNRIFCNIVMAKSRVTALKFVSVPRLELTATPLAVQVATHLKQELESKLKKKYFGLTAEWCYAKFRTSKKASKCLWPILSYKSKAILMCHSGIQTNENYSR